MKNSTGQIIMIQESRFWLHDDQDMAKHFTIAADAQLPNTDLHTILEENRSVSVSYEESQETLTYIVHDIAVV